MGPGVGSSDWEGLWGGWGTAGHLLSPGPGGCVHDAVTLRGFIDPCTHINKLFWILFYISGNILNIKTKWTRRGWEITWLPSIFVRTTQGTSLVVQWLRLCTSNTGSPGSITDQGTRGHVPQLKILHAETKMEKIPCATTKTRSAN